DASTARVSEAQLRCALRELDRSAAALVEAGRALALVRRPPPPAVTWCRDAHAIAATAVSGPTPGPASRSQPWEAAIPAPGTHWQ
uniref:hypothetical protein n=1 Tax=Microbacterium sp. B19 TaxID=96765 RepID=UPI0016519181